MYENENIVGAGLRGGSALTGFVMGAIVGAGIALLMAPATGTDTRRRLRQTRRSSRAPREPSWETRRRY